MTLGEIRDRLAATETGLDETEDEIRLLIESNPVYAEIVYEVTEASEALHRAIDKLDQEAMRGH